MRTLKFLSFIILILISTFASGQSGEIEMADAMRESGKIYVVVAVLCTVFVGLIIYTTMIDRRLSKLEKEQIEK